jgi:hypothetical protein
MDANLVVALLHHTIDSSTAARPLGLTARLGALPTIGLRLGAALHAPDCRLTMSPRRECSYIAMD